MVKVHGNVGAALNGKTFAGGSTKIIPFGWVAVTADNADVAVIEAAQIPFKYGAVNLGLYFQSEVPVTIDFTLCHPEQAIDLDPAVQTGVLWGGTKTLAAKEIWGLMMVCTAIRIRFGGKGTCYVGAG